MTRLTALDRTFDCVRDDCLRERWDCFGPEERRSVKPYWPAASR
jgi:hypothetical protein